MIVIWLASWLAFLRYWVVSSMLVFWVISWWMVFYSCMWLLGLSLVVGLLSRRRCGVLIRFVFRLSW